ncbi:LysR family transcriptional regulator [Methylobacterium nonmethylotrophicum]|uniref:LysR family transcriptional regulator n=1 Tax=Methylobacterium nonmethylotrophicum TaxID=1141884 RepID=A0A4Z0NR82_9HYPH|nr:LysR family transcriptional regulator [Methylobacterium nonmethylotrophicum]TGD99651.1 LysR family transcriptional regulator [Methylobacterium nonmethylotrophicum]
MIRGTEFAELRAFAAVAQERSFRRAAARLGVTPSALSHVIRALEERLGAKLLHRTTRSVAPTEAGAALLERLVPAVAEIEQAVSEVGAFSDRPRGRLRLNLPRLAAEAVLIPRLGQFTQLYPDIVFDLMIDDGMADIVAEGFDAGIRSGSHVHGDMIAVPLTPHLRVAVVASPAYVASRGSPATPSDLREHRCINYRWARDGAVYRWRFERSGETVEIRVDAVITVNDTNLIIGAALAGIGFAYILEDVVSEHIAAGRLVRVLDEWCQPVTGFHLYYSGRRHLSAPLRALIEFFRFGTPSAHLFIAQ